MMSKTETSTSVNEDYTQGSIGLQYCDRRVYDSSKSDNADG